MNRLTYLPLAAIALIACGAIKQSPINEKNVKCKRSHLSKYSFDGSSLRNKQLSLTFDDGPGSRTEELSEYLKDQNIQAAFFVNGHCFNQDGLCGSYKSPDDILPHLINDGHLIGNHTQDHFNLTDPDKFPLTPDGDSKLCDELKQTNDIIAPYINYNMALFRPPYGAFNDRDYNLLHSSPSNNYVGPINWDIGGAITNGYGADWDCWQNTTDAGVKSTNDCANLYLNEIHSKNRGIILMHDADYNKPGSGNTIDMVKFLVPILKSEGYSFVRVDQVPDIADALGQPIIIIPEPSEDIPDASTPSPIDASVPPKGVGHKKHYDASPNNPEPITPPVPSSDDMDCE